MTWEVLLVFTALKLSRFIHIYIYTHTHRYIYIYIHTHTHTYIYIVSQSCLTLCDHKKFSPPGSSVYGDSLGKNTGVACHALLQRIFPTQQLNPGLQHCRWILYPLRHQWSPWILEWVAYPIPRASSQPWNRTRVSCIAGRFFTSWATREALGGYKPKEVKGSLISAPQQNTPIRIPKQCIWEKLKDTVYEKKQQKTKLENRLQHHTGHKMPWKYVCLNW